MTPKDHKDATVTAEYSVMNEEKCRFLHQVDQLDQGRVIIKVTGREGVDLAPHRHHCIQMVETVAGSLHVTVGEREYFVPEGYSCWISSGMTHALTSNNRKITLRIYYFQLPPHEAEAFKPFSVLYVCPWARTNLSFIAKRGPVIDKSDAGFYSFCISFFETFRKVERQLSLPLRGINSESSPTLRKAMAYLHKHLAFSIKADDVARAAGVSTRTLSRLFSESGTTLSDYLCYQRVIRSLELMADNTLSIKQIAYDTGFSSPANFNRAFKQVTGLPPKEMRLRHRE